MYVSWLTLRGSGVSDTTVPLVLLKSILMVAIVNGWVPQHRSSSAVIVAVNPVVVTTAVKWVAKVAVITRAVGIGDR